MLAVAISAAPPETWATEPIERFRLRSCAHKRSYRSRRIAKAIARATQRSAPERGHVHAYYCSFCDRWHVGHTGR
jgi:hypothetical protein